MYNYQNYEHFCPVVTGIGITSAIGQGKTEFLPSLFEGRHKFNIMQRPGRQKGTNFIGAEISGLTFPEQFSSRMIRTTSHTEQVALVTLYEAWQEANLDSVDPERIGLIVGGSNLQSRHLYQIQDNYKDKISFLNPTYGFTFMDSDLCGLCTEQFGIKGFAYTVGGASASGQLCIIQAIQAIQSGLVDVCIALGSLMDISFWECQALKSLGAMGSDRYASEPGHACRPFDKNRDGFIYGECCGAIVLENIGVRNNSIVKPYASIDGWGICVDGNRNPNPSFEGECKAIAKALNKGNIKAKDIDYINPHGTGSIIGDEIELRALQESSLNHAFINATKSITGHGLTAAGTVEVIATLLQMKNSQLHPTRNLEEPMDSNFNWVSGTSISQNVKNALTLSMGFGGINTALCLQKIV